MESNDALKEIDIKNRTCYSFDVIMKIEIFNLDNHLIDETLIDAKPFRIKFYRKDGFIRV